MFGIPRASYRRRDHPLYEIDGRIDGDIRRRVSRITWRPLVTLSAAYRADYPNFACPDMIGCHLASGIALPEASARRSDHVLPSVCARVPTELRALSRLGRYSSFAARNTPSEFCALRQYSTFSTALCVVLPAFPRIASCAFTRVTAESPCAPFWPPLCNKDYRLGRRKHAFCSTQYCLPLLPR